MDRGCKFIERRKLLAWGAGLFVITQAPVSSFAAKPHPSQRRKLMLLVIREAQNLGVSPSLALAVARVESDFDPYAVSHAGARGLMQIMPRTARTEYGIQAELLWNPRINTRLGLHFLKRLLIRYKGRVDLALSHYNGGSAVGAWPNSRVIPATRNYVRKVQRYRTAYRRDMGFEDEHSGYRIAGKQVSRRRQEF